jgi:hypothetical protein
MPWLQAVAVLVIAWFVVTASTAAAQESLSPELAARVGEEPISKRQVEAWVRKQRRGAARRGRPVDPPRFRRCVAVRKRLARPGAPAGRRGLRRRCRRRYQAMRTQAMVFLVQSAWTRQEAAARGIAVAPRRVRRELRSQRQQSFNSAREFRRFLRRSGMTLADILYRIRVDLLQTRIVEQVARSVPPVTPDEVTDYYESHRRSYRGMSRRRARRVIRRLLVARREQAAIADFAREFRERYREMTLCAGRYVVAECANSAPAQPSGTLSAGGRS